MRPITRKETNAEKFNGRSLHELWLRFNQREKALLIQGCYSEFT